MSLEPPPRTFFHLYSTLPRNRLQISSSKTISIACDLIFTSKPEYKRPSVSVSRNYHTGRRVKTIRTGRSRSKPSHRCTRSMYLHVYKRDALRRHSCTWSETCDRSWGDQHRVDIYTYILYITRGTPVQIPFVRGRRCRETSPRATVPWLGKGV